jgi:hypothetical protein
MQRAALPGDLAGALLDPCTQPPPAPTRMLKRLIGRPPTGHAASGSSLPLPVQDLPEASPHSAFLWPRYAAEGCALRVLGRGPL